MKIVKNKVTLKRGTRPCDSIEEGERIAKKLSDVLDDIGGYGLAANQIGINKNVCIVRVRDDSPDRILINPTITKSSDDRVLYFEGCLSIPGKRTKTIRHSSVTVACDNWENEIEFCPDGELTKENFWDDNGLLECVCVQHEVDHLNGVLMTDPSVRYIESATPKTKYGRNEKVVVEKDGDTQYLKYKNAEALLVDGWNII